MKLSVENAEQNLWKTYDHDEPRRKAKRSLTPFGVRSTRGVDHTPKRKRDSHSQISSRNDTYPYETPYKRSKRKQQTSAYKKRLSEPKQVEPNYLQSKHQRAYNYPQKGVWRSRNEELSLMQNQRKQ